MCVCGQLCGRQKKVKWKGEIRRFDSYEGLIIAEYKLLFQTTLIEHGDRCSQTTQHCTTQVSK
jgi:hypothetical protein